MRSGEILTHLICAPPDTCRTTRPGGPPPADRGNNHSSAPAPSSAAPFCVVRSTIARQVIHTRCMQIDCRTLCGDDGGGWAVRYTPDRKVAELLERRQIGSGRHVGARTWAAGYGNERAAKRRKGRRDEAKGSGQRRSRRAILIRGGIQCFTSSSPRLKVFQSFSYRQSTRRWHSRKLKKCGIV